MFKSLFRTVSYILLFHILMQPCFAQDKVICSVGIKPDSFYEKIGKKIPLENLLLTNDSIYFRFRKSNQIVDIWSEDGEIFKGVIINYTYKQKSDDEVQPQNTGRLFLKRIAIDSRICRRIYHISENIAAIPTQDSIPGWDWGTDYSQVTFEIVSPGYYCRKEYKEPKNTSVPQAKIVQNVIDSFDTLLRLQKSFDDFTNSLPFGCCYTLSPFLWLRKLNKAQSMRAKKNQPYLQYLDSISRTLNQYLSDTLTNIFSKKNTIEYTHAFYLKFSRKNKLIKLTAKKEPYDKDDRRDYRRCKKMIIQAFRKINLDFVHAQIPYSRELFLTPSANATVYDR